MSSQQPAASMFVALALFLGCLLVVNAQMTFSDGWGKRSGAPTPFALLQQAASKRQQLVGTGRGPVSELFMGDAETMSAEMEACHEGYFQRVVQLHQKMLALYDTYQQCQAKAAGPKKPSQKV